MATPAISKLSLAVLLMFLVLNCFQQNLICEAKVLQMNFSGRVVTDLAVNLPAAELWAVFRSPDYLKLLARLDPAFYRSVTFVSGNGEVGTIVNITLQPEVGGGYWYDEITKIDDATRTRELTHRQGNFRNAGFPLFQSEYIIIQNGLSASIIRLSFIFRINQASLSNISQVPTFWVPQMTIANYVNSGRSAPVVLWNKLSGQIISDMRVNLPANRVWGVYRRKNFSILIGELMPNFLRPVQYIIGDGGLGTVANVTLQPAFGSTNWLEKLIVFDEATMTRVVRQIRGGLLDLGFVLYESGFRIMQESANSCTIRVFVPFKIKTESMSNASTLKPYWDITIALANYINTLKKRFE